ARVPGTVEYLPDAIDIGRPVKAGGILLKLAIPDLLADKKHKEALLEQARKQKVQTQESQTVAAKEVEEAQKMEQRYAADHAYQKLRHERISKLVKDQAQQVEVEQEALRQLEAAAAAWQAARAQIDTRQAKARATLADLEVAQRRIEVADAEVQKVA